MRYRQAAAVYLGGTALEALISLLVLPQDRLRSEATPLLVGLGYVVIFALAVFNAPRWGSGRPVVERTLQVLVFVLGLNALVRGALFALSLIPGDVSLVVRTQQWTATPLYVSGPGGLAAGVKAVIEGGIAYAMGRALWDWPPATKEAKEGAGKRKAARRHSSSRA